MVRPEDSWEEEVDEEDKWHPEGLRRGHVEMCPIGGGCLNFTDFCLKCGQLSPSKSR